MGFTEEQAVAEALRCLNCGVCSECRQCEIACQPQAIDHDMRDEVVELDVGAVVVATGFDPFDATRKPEFGYGRYPNVLSGLEFERLASASGPTAGKIKVNGREPEEIVFVHCVGSRDKAGAADGSGEEYCSRICCMYTAKQAHLAHDKAPGSKITVFYMDVRAFGKGFEEFYDRVRAEGIIYRRGNPAEIYKRGDKLIVRAEDTLLGKTVEVPADLVVLATGVQPRADADRWRICWSLNSQRTVSLPNSTPSCALWTHSGRASFWPGTARHPRTSLTPSLRPKRQQDEPSSPCRSSSESGLPIPCRALLAKSEGQHIIWEKARGGEPCLEHVTWASPLRGCLDL